MKSYEKKKNSNNHLIFQEWNDTKNHKSVLEILPPTDEFDKVILQIQKTTDGKTVTTYFYMEIEDMLTLCHNIMQYSIQGVIQQSKEKALETNSYPEQLFLERGGNEKDGNVTARSFYFQATTRSESSNVMVIIENGKGYKTKDGLFNIDYKANDFVRNSVAMSYKTFMKMAVSCYSRLNAIIISREMRGFYIPRYEPTQQINEQTPYPNNQICDTYSDYTGDLR